MKSGQVALNPLQVTVLSRGGQPDFAVLFFLTFLTSFDDSRQLIYCWLHLFHGDLSPLN